MNGNDEIYEFSAGVGVIRYQRGYERRFFDYPCFNTELLDGVGKSPDKIAVNVVMMTRSG